MTKKILIAFIWLWLIGTQSVFSQYDARKLKKIYGQLFRIELLSHQIQTDFILQGKRIMPMDSEEKKRLDEEAARTALDSILLLIPSNDKDFLHDFLRIKKQMDIAFASVNSGYNDETRSQSVKLFNRLRNHITLLEKKLLLLLSIQEPDLALLDKIRQVNEDNETAFQQYLTEGKTPRNLYKSALKELSKIRENYKKNNDLQFLITNMQSDLKTFDLAMKNHYKADILYKPYEKFTQKIRRLFSLVYAKIKVV